MADIVRKRAENIEGSFYVDDTCIDCDTCRWIAPKVFREDGGMVLLYAEKFLFTGGHLAYSEEKEHLVGFRSACWYSWPELVSSTERLAKYDFEWVLPGHGRRFHAPRAGMKTEMKKCLDWMRSVS